MKELILVGLGGFLGAPSRYLLGKKINRHWKGHFPLATFIINVLGCFLLGILVFHFKLASESSVYQSLGIGYLGSFTTFSTFQYENLDLLEKGRRGILVIYTLSSFIFGIAAVWLTATL